MKTPFRIVPDTNIILARFISQSEDSPNIEILRRWMNQEFELLYSVDTLREYVVLLQRKGVEKRTIIDFIKLIRKAELVYIEYFHYWQEKYPVDLKDMAFILCADNGKASHLLSYDAHLLDIGHQHTFRICRPVSFLKELRDTLKEG